MSTVCLANNLLRAETARQEFERQISELLGYEANVEIRIHSAQGDTHPLAHDACLIEHSVERGGGCLWVRVGKTTNFNVFVQRRRVGAK